MYRIITNVCYISEYIWKSQQKNGAACLMLLLLNNIKPLRKLIDKITFINQFCCLVWKIEGQTWSGRPARDGVILRCIPWIHEQETDGCKCILYVLKTLHWCVLLANVVGAKGDEAGGGGDEEGEKTKEEGVLPNPAPFSPLPQVSKKTWIPACPLGKQLSHFACSEPLLARLYLIIFWKADSPGPLLIGEVSFKSYLPRKKIYLSMTIVP